MIKFKLSKLIDVKSIITLSLTLAVIIIMISTGKIPEQLNSIYLIIIGFYFGTQSEKDTKAEEG